MACSCTGRVHGVTVTVSLYRQLSAVSRRYCFFVSTASDSYTLSVLLHNGLQVFRGEDAIYVSHLMAEHCVVLIFLAPLLVVGLFVN